MNGSLEIQVEMLTYKIKHYLITTMGKTIDECTFEEFYRSFCYTIREEIMINWTATAHTIKKNRARILYYLCMEYMPGRLLGNNLTNIHSTHLVQKVLAKLGKDYNLLLAHEPDFGLGNGGLGRLAACFLDSLATQEYPAIAYGLRYQYGIFDQEIWDGVQIERPDNWLLHENPWEFRRDAHAVSIYYCGRAIPKNNQNGVEVYDLSDYDEVRALSYDTPIIGYKESAKFVVNTLRLWTTKESPRNFQLQRFNAGQLDQASENTSLTDVLYPNDNNETGKRIRLKQEFLLASASLQDILHHFEENYTNIQELPDKVRIHINDTHPSLVIPELFHILLHRHALRWEEAWEMVKTCCNFTNHTILKESLEEWNQQRISYLLPRQYHIIERLNQELCNTIRAKFPNDENKVRRMSILEGGQVRMAHLCIYGSHRVNGVAALHTQILKESTFKDFYEMYPEKFVNVTNGVTQRRWLLYANPELASFITKRIGKKWIEDFSHIKELAKFAKEEESQKEFLAIKRKNKERLLDFIAHHNPIRDQQGHAVGHFPARSPDALFDVHIKRFHEYKRQLMNILHVLMVYQELKEDINKRASSRLVLFAGKAAPGYVQAKNIITFIYCVARTINADPIVSKKLQVVFIENYNVSRAEIIIPAADLSEQISTAGMEASGTGNMKLAMNGALTIGTEDGANIEMHEQVGNAYWPFVFGASALENEKTRREGSYQSWEVYMKNEAIRKAVDCLRDHSLTQSKMEDDALAGIYYELLEQHNSTSPDKYFVLRDLEAYYETQKKVEVLYLKPSLWAEYAINNIAAMYPFSSDESIKNYAELIWNLKKCPLDEKELERVRAEYSEHDKCRIF